MKNKITNFKIIKLWGTKSFEIKIEDNTLVIIAENGAGKTTLLRVFYYFLSQQWDKLAEINFERITATIDDKEHSIKRTDILRNYDDAFFEKLVEKYPDPEEKKFILGKFKDALLSKGLSNLSKPAVLTRIEEVTELSQPIILNIIKEAVTPFNLDFTIPVIFLPTYRRIEKSILDILGKLEMENENKTQTISLLQTQNLSVSDVFNEIQTMYKSSKKTDKGYLEVSDVFGLDELEDELNRAIQNKKMKKSLDHFLILCNGYLKNKELEIDEEKNIRVKISSSGYTSKLSEKGILSSGEQQILSLFYYLLLDERKFFVIIDEPEISISVMVQERLLPDIKSTGCLGMIVATHSPLICDKNGYNQYTEIMTDFEIKKG